MKILWLYRYTSHRHYIHWFHTDFARVISEQENVTLKMYGYRMHERKEFKDLLLKEYSENITMAGLKREFNYDVVILDCWNRAYKDIYAKELWLPKDFKSCIIPKVVIEGDYHNIRDPKWYTNLNIDLILHRHLSNVKRAKKDLSIKSLWLPCSIDNNIFKDFAWSTSKGGRVLTQMKPFGIFAEYDEDISTDILYITLNFKNQNEECDICLALVEYVERLIKVHGNDDGYELFMKADMRLFMK